MANGITVSHAMARELLGAERFQTYLDQAKRSESFQGKTFVQKSKGKFEYREANEGAKASNVLAVIEGTDKKDEYLVLTAHYDHLGKRGNTITTEPMTMAVVPVAFWKWRKPSWQRRQPDKGLGEPSYS